MALIGHTNLFDIEHQIGPPRGDIGGLVSTDALFQQRGQSGLRGEMQHLRLAKKRAAPVQPERQQTVALG